MLPALLVIVLMPVISFAMFKFVMMPMIKAETASLAEAGHAEIKAEDITIEHGSEASHSFDFEPIVTNVKGTSLTRFLQVSFTIQSAYPNIADEVAKKKVQMQDISSSVLGGLTLADLEKPEIKNIVRNQLKQGFNHAFGKPMVEEIYFSQFVVQ